MGGYWSGKAPLAPLPTLAHPAAFLCGISWGFLVSSRRRISRRGRLHGYDKCWAPAMCLWFCFSFVCSSNNLEGGPWFVLCCGGELLLQALAGSMPPPPVWLPIKLVGAGLGLGHRLLAGGNAQGRSILPLSSFLYRHGVEEKGGREGTWEWERWCKFL